MITQLQFASNPMYGSEPTVTDKEDQRLERERLKSSKLKFIVEYLKTVMRKCIFLAPFIYYKLNMNSGFCHPRKEFSGSHISLIRLPGNTDCNKM